METPRLTTRELEVLQLLCKGKQAKEVADKLKITLNTVETYQRILHLKFDVHNRAELITKAARLKLVEL